MSGSRGSPKIFFGWWTVLACSVIGFLGVGIVGPGLSVLFKPIASELGLTRAVASLAASVQSLGQGISGPTAGWAADRYGPRRVMMSGIILMVVGLVAMFFVRSLWSFLLVWGLLVGIGFSLGCTVVTDVAIVRWFSRRSGIAVNTKFAVQSLSGLLLLPLIAWFSISHGWRLTYVAAAGLIAVVCVPLAWLFVRPHRPEHYGLLPDGAVESPAVNTAAGTVYARAQGRSSGIQPAANDEDSSVLVDDSRRIPVRRGRTDNGCSLYSLLDGHGDYALWRLPA